jgi:ribose-phosphate pyrophosphokinase
MNENFYGHLTIIGMKGCEKFLSMVDDYLRDWRKTGDVSFITEPELIRFGTGEGKCVLHNSMRGHDVYIISDVFNYGVKYKMYGQEHCMSPDDHFQDLKRLIGAIEGKARRISVIMPMLYEGRQHKRTTRESLDCASALQELVSMGVTNIITFDAHDPRVQNAIPLHGFDNVQPTYQMIKSLVRNVSGVQLNADNMMVVSPDEGGMGRCMYYASILGLELGMFYKRRDYSVVKDGKNPIVAHEYLGKSVAGKDVIIADDMISSGESILDVAKQLKARKARRIFVFATFGLFCNGFEKFDEAYKNGEIDRIFTTNLNYRPEEILEKPWYTEVNLCKYVAYIIDTLNYDNTISGLLNPADRIKSLLKKNAAKNNTNQQ